jgi:hypothetical protein
MHLIPQPFLSLQVADGRLQIAEVEGEKGKSGRAQRAQDFVVKPPPTQDQ